MLLLTLLLVFDYVLAQPSQCPDVFAYENKSERDRWYGRITLTTPRTLNGIFIAVELDAPAIILGNWFGESTTENNHDFIIKNRNQVLHPTSEPLSIRFFVRYDPTEGVPSVLRIKLNGHIICGKPETTESPVLHLSNFKPTTATTTTEDEFFGGDFSDTRRPIITIPTRPVPSADACGTVQIEVRPLVTYGQGTTEGEWPWHAALYRYKGANLQYLCGGSLISRSHVITAAHCVTKSKTNIVINHELLLIYLGKYNLYKQDGSVQNAGVNKITVHHEYNASFLHNDIAILHLQKPAEITDYVRTVCLWQEDIDLTTIINRLGTVVGWGFDETGDVTETLMQAKMPVVSTETCIFSNRDFFSRFTSDKTYCAGFRNGTSACTGDSGGGMVFSKTVGTSMIWQLRGVISLSVALQNEKVVCDTSNYIVFTDVAKHLDWIRSTISS